uniref:cytochrome-b5 reductase n=1 Tax=Aegilops tauschii subsp. strangulata TaxID=200361 RepID=A0A453FSP1_AEGTS
QTQLNLAPNTAARGTQPTPAPRDSVARETDRQPRGRKGAMDFLQGRSVETMVAVAVAVVAVAVGGALLLRRSKRPKGCLDPENFKKFKLVEKTQISHNVAKFRFALPTPTSVLGLPIGQHISCRGQDATGEEVIKPYTPTTLDSDLGNFQLVIKDVPSRKNVASLP